MGNFQAGRYSQKNTPSNDPPSNDPFEELKEFLGYNPGELSDDERIDEEAKLIIKDAKNSHLEDDLRWFHKRENLKDAAKVLRKTERILKLIAPYIRDDPGNQTIQVGEFKNRQLKEDTLRVLKLVDYLASGHLKRIAASLERYITPSNKAPKYAIKIAAEEVANLYRDEGKRIDWNKIAEMVLEEFPDPQGRNSATPGEWIRQLVKRK
jgi:hypothetical protein